MQGMLTSARVWQGTGMAIELLLRFAHISPAAGTAGVHASRRRVADQGQRPNVRGRPAAGEVAARAGEGMTLPVCDLSTFPMARELILLHRVPVNECNALLWVAMTLSFHAS